MIGAGLRRLLATTAMRRVSRSGRSPGGWDGPRPPSRRTCTTRLERRPEPSSAATRAYAAAAARRPRCATARATPTSTPKPATPGDRHPVDSRTSARRDARLARPLRPPPLRIRLVAHPARRRGAQALERLDDGEWPPASVVGDVFGTWEGARAAARADTSPRERSPAAPIPCSAAAAGVRAAHDRSSRTHQGRLDRVLERADRLGAGRFRAAPWWAPLGVAGHPARFGSRNAAPQAFPGTGPIPRDPPPPQDASARTHPVSSQRPPHRSECR